MSPLRDRPNVDGVKDLVMRRTLGAAHVGQLPLEVVLQVLHAVEGDLELEGAPERGGVVQHHHIVDLHLRHGAEKSSFNTAGHTASESRKMEVWDT